MLFVAAASPDIRSPSQTRVTTRQVLHSHYTTKNSLEELIVYKDGFSPQSWCLLTGIISNRSGVLLRYLGSVSGL